MDKPIDCEWKGLQSSRCDEPWQENDLCLDFLSNTIAIYSKIRLQDDHVVYARLSKNIVYVIFLIAGYRVCQKDTAAERYLNAKRACLNSSHIVTFVTCKGNFCKFLHGL